MPRVIRLVIGFAFMVAFADAAQGQNLPKVRAAYTSIGIQFDPVYIMKELDLPRKYGLDVDVLFVPVSSRAIQAALAGEIQFITSGGVANINANVTGADFVGLTATLSTFVFKVIASPELKKPEQLRGKKVGISRLGGASDFSIRYALGRWGLVPDKDVAIIQVGGEQEEVLALQNKAVDAVILSEPFATLAIRAGASMLADLSQLGVPYTMHGFGARKSFIRANRDVTIRFMKAYLEGHLCIQNEQRRCAERPEKIYAARRYVPGANVVRGDVSETDPESSPPGPRRHSDHHRSTRQDPPANEKSQPQRLHRSVDLERNRGQRLH